MLRVAFMSSDEIRGDDKCRLNPKSNRTRPSARRDVKPRADRRRSRPRPNRQRRSARPRPSTLRRTGPRRRVIRIAPTWTRSARPHRCRIGPDDILTKFPCWDGTEEPSQPFGFQAEASAQAASSGVCSPSSQLANSTSGSCGSARLALMASIEIGRSARRDLPSKQAPCSILIARWWISPTT